MNKTPARDAPVVGTLALNPRRTMVPRKVLIVEDNLDSVHTIAYLVMEMGHEVRYGINGYAALEVGRKFKPDFVLLDLGLPGMDGYEVCRRMRDEPAFEKSRIVAVTAYGDDEARAKSRFAGCELHLVKPVNAQALFDLLDSSLAE